MVKKATKNHCISYSWDGIPDAEVSKASKQRTRNGKPTPYALAAQRELLRRIRNRPLFPGIEEEAKEKDNTTWTAYATRNPMYIDVSDEKLRELSKGENNFIDFFGTEGPTWELRRRQQVRRRLLK